MDSTEQIFKEKLADAQKTHSKSKKRSYEEALSEFDLNEDDVNKLQRVAYSKEKTDILKVNNIASEYKHTLEGKKKDEGDSSYVQAGRALAGQKTIDLTYSMLMSFADQSNLMSKKEYEQFMLQFRDCFNKATNVILRDRSISPEHQPILITLFKDKMYNIGQIITDNQDVLDKIIASLRFEAEEGRDPFGGEK